MNDDPHIGHTLRSFRLWINDLRWYLATRAASDLSELDERRVESFPFEWDDVVDRIKTMGQRAADGELTSTQLAELRAITAELVEAQPAREGFRLRYPDLDALRRATLQRTASSPTAPQST